jgi:hypothetical protein
LARAGAWPAALVGAAQPALRRMLVKEGKGAIKWTRLSSRSFAADSGRQRRSLRLVPDGRGRGAAADVCRNRVAYLPVQAPPLQDDSGGVRSNGRRKQKYARMRGKEFRTPEASSPNDWLRTRLVAAEIYCGAPSVRRKIALNQ